jgi:hypothetical protein
MNQALYAHMNNKRKKNFIMQEIKKKKKKGNFNFTVYTTSNFKMHLLIDLIIKELNVN